MELLVVGAGGMGRWVASALSPPEDRSARGPDSESVDVAFADADPEAAEAAAERAGGRAVPLDVEERFDAVCVAVPIPAVEDAVAAHADRADRAVFDVTGTMAAPVEAMVEHAPDRERLSLHPLFAPENAPGNVAVVEAASGPVTRRVLDRLSARGNALVETAPAEHDRAMETVQASAHAAVLAFALAADPVPEGLRTPVFDRLADLAAQVTDGTPRVYAEIQEAFDGADDVARAASRIAAADAAEFERLYREADDR